MKRQTSSGMPQLRGIFGRWAQHIVLLKHSEIVTNGIVTIEQKQISFYGTIQPLSPRSIALKPEGQRSWTWLQIHCQARATNLLPGDFITWQGDRYKVMEKKDYSLNGYMEFHAVRDYQTGGTA